MDSIAVRQEEPIVEEKVERSDSKPDFSPEIDEFQHKNYYLELLEVGEAKDHFQMPELVKEINEFLKSQSKDKASYQKVLDTYLKRVPDLDIYAKTERIAELIRVDKKLLDAAREKEELFKKPITEMTSSQLKEYINASTHN